jgi:hypothetical protein
MLVVTASGDVPFAPARPPLPFTTWPFLFRTVVVNELVATSPSPDVEDDELSRRVVADEVLAVLALPVPALALPARPAREELMPADDMVIEVSPTARTRPYSVRSQARMCSPCDQVEQK